MHGGDSKDAARGFNRADESLGALKRKECEKVFQSQLIPTTLLESKYFITLIEDFNFNKRRMLLRWLFARTVKTEHILVPRESLWAKSSYEFL